jgi:hypothetical protein
MNTEILYVVENGKIIEIETNDKNVPAKKIETDLEAWLSDQA